MESIIKSDMFFFITSISVIIITIFLVVSLFYLIKILRNFHKISEILKNYTEDTDEGLRGLAEHVRSSRLFTFFFGKEKKKKLDKSHVKSV